jgi:hypothetical protein
MEESEHQRQKWAEEANRKEEARHRQTEYVCEATFDRQQIARYFIEEMDGETGLVQPKPPRKIHMSALSARDLESYNFRRRSNEVLANHAK